jgi:hypothetical protein
MAFYVPSISFVLEQSTEGQRAHDKAARAEAEALQQRAERKRGEDAVRAHGQAAVTALVTHLRLPHTVRCQCS